jgi:hypothetical protein
VKPLSYFYDFVMPELPGVTTALVDLHLVHVARDFCTRSRAWRDDFTPIDVLAGVATYDLSPSQGSSETVTINKLTLNGDLLFDDQWERNRHCVTPTPDLPKYTQRTPFSLGDDSKTITLIDDEVPDADATAALLLTGSIRPAVTAKNLPDLLTTTWLEAMRTGLLFRLMVMPTKPWTQLAQAGMYRSDYERLIGAAAAFAQRGNVNQRLRSRPY